MFKLSRTNLDRNRSRNQHLHPVNCSVGLVNAFKTTAKHYSAFSCGTPFAASHACIWPTHSCSCIPSKPAANNERIQFETFFDEKLSQCSICEAAKYTPFPCNTTKALLKQDSVKSLTLQHMNCIKTSIDFASMDSPAMASSACALPQCHSPTRICIGLSKIGFDLATVRPTNIAAV